MFRQQDMEVKSWNFVSIVSASLDGDCLNLKLVAMFSTYTNQRNVLACSLVFQQV